MTTPGTKMRALCVATRCTTVEQFVATFHRFCGDDQSFFVATMTSRPIGLETPFSIQLADKQPVLRGMCIVLDAWATPENRYKRPGIRLGIKRLTADSQVVFDRLKAAAKRPTEIAEPSPPPGPPPGPAIGSGSQPLSVRASATPPPLPPLVSPQLSRSGRSGRASTATPPPILRAPAMPPRPPEGKGTLPRLRGLESITPVPGVVTVPPLPSVVGTRAATPPSLPVVTVPPLPAPPAASAPAASPAPPAPVVAKPSSPSPAPAALPSLTSPPGAAPLPSVVPLAARSAPAASPASSPSPASAPSPPPPAPASEARQDASSSQPVARPQPEPIAVTRFQVALNVAAAPPSIEDVEFKPQQLQRRPPRLVGEPPAEPRSDDRVNDGLPSMIVDRPSAGHELPPADTDLPLDSEQWSSDTVPNLAGPEAARALGLGSAADLRTPGSTLVLPANPLQDLSDESLEGFVDCTLYEDTVIVQPASEDGDWGDELMETAVNPRADARARAAASSGNLPVMPFDTPPQLMVRAVGDSESLRLASDAPRVSPADARVTAPLPAAAAPPVVESPPPAAEPPPADESAPIRRPPTIELSPLLFTPQPFTVELPPEARPGSEPPSGPGVNPTDALFAPLHERPGSATGWLESAGAAYRAGDGAQAWPPGTGLGPGEIAMHGGPMPYPAVEPPHGGPMPYPAVEPPHGGPMPYPPLGPPGGAMPYAPGAPPPHGAPHAAFPPGHGPMPHMAAAPLPQAMASIAMVPPHAPRGDASEFARYAPTSRVARSMLRTARSRMRRLASGWPRWLLIAGSAVVAIVLAFVLARMIRGPVAPQPAPPGRTGTPRPAAPATAPPAGHGAQLAPPATGSSASTSALGAAPRAPAAAPAAPAAARAATAEAAPAARTAPPARGDAPAAAAGDDTEGPPDDDGEAVTGGTPVVGSGPCRFTVATTPAGSVVRVDDQSLGTSPITIEGTCDKHKVDVSHVRYQSVTRWVTPTADKPQELDISLPRPIHAVTVTSFPPGAELSIDGHHAGTTPTVVQVMGFATVNLKFTKQGFQTVTKKVYSKTPQDRVFVKLAK